MYSKKNFNRTNGWFTCLVVLYRLYMFIIMEIVTTACETCVFIPEAIIQAFIGAQAKIALNGKHSKCIICK